MPRRPSRSAANRRDDQPTRGARGDGGAPMVRIVGGTHRRRRLAYSGDPRVRPMKDRTREALFNLLGPSVVGTYAFDLFAGTGVLAMEAVSRGSVGGLAIEWHMATAQLIRTNIATLGETERIHVAQASAFAWGTTIWTFPHKLPTTTPWTVFCCPPYAFYTDRSKELLALLQRVRAQAPAGSSLVVEAACPFAFETLWEAPWRTRDYPPTALGIVQLDENDGPRPIQD